MRRVLWSMLLAAALAIGISITAGSDVVFKRGVGVEVATPGVLGSRGNDRYVSYLKDLTTVQGLRADDFRRTYWFSPALGSDSALGTKDEPLRTFGKLAALCVDFVECIVRDDGPEANVFSPNTLIVEPESVADFPVGSSVTWGPAACPEPASGTVIGRHQSGVVMVRRATTGTAVPAAVDNLCAENGTTSVVIDDVVDTINNAVMTRTLGCDRADRPCTAVRAENPTHPAVFDFDRLIGAGARFVAQDTGGGANGWFHLENIHCLYPANDCFDTATVDHGKLSGLNLNAISWNIGTGGDSNNNGLSTHGQGWILCANCRSYSFATSNTGAGAPVAPTGIGGNLLINNSIVVEHQTATTTTSAIGQTGGSVYLLDTYVGTGPGTPAGTWDASNLRGDGTPGATTKAFNLVSSRSVFSAGTLNPRRAIIVGHNTATVAGAVTNLSLYETTASGSRCLNTSSADDGTINVVARGLVLDECTTNTLLTASITGVTFDLQGVVDPEDIGTLCSINGVTSDTIAGCQALAPTFFQANSFDSGGASDGIAWSLDARAQSLGVIADFNDANPDTITRTVGSFVTDGFTAGMRIGATLTANAANGRILRVASVSALTLTLHPSEVLTAAVTDTVNLREYTLPQLAMHPESEGYAQPVSLYSFTIESDGCIPPFWHVGGETVCTIERAGMVGGR